MAWEFYSRDLKSYLRLEAVVEYDPAIVTASDLTKTVNDLGYIATAKR